MAVKNRFNNITSKEWLPFQKSWFIDSGLENLYKSNIRFFTQINEENPLPKVFYSGPFSKIFKQISLDEGRQACSIVQENLSFAILDLRERFVNLKSYLESKDELFKNIEDIYHSLAHRKFLCIYIENLYDDNYLPISWDLAQNLKTLFSLKDEKIGCFKTAESLEGDKVYYAMYFRKDEKSNGQLIKTHSSFLDSSKSIEKESSKGTSAWKVVRPPRRKKNEVLHPAKYPEQLIDSFINEFSKEDDNVLDPMSGTGSTQVSALQNKRNGYGTELSPFFHEIALNRCAEVETEHDFSIKLADAQEIDKQGFPLIDYIITSPPYWDMLNMKGAEYQARRKEKGLQLNYSDHKSDLGNVADYDKFLDELMKVYTACNKLLKPGGHATIIVKNIKKKGSNYPFAWDLSERLCKMGWEILPEFFWCQDDINIAPYGYGNTWVSNTFHQYCLNFKKPENS